MGFVGVRHKPSDVRRRCVIVASARLAERSLIPVAVEAGLARAIKNGGKHALAKFRKNGSDVQISFHTWRKISYVFLCPRILQIVERTAVRKGRRERGKLQRSDLNSLTEAGHPRNAT